MNKIRIAHILCTPAFGGPDSLVLSLFERLDRSRFESYLIFLQGSQTANKILVEKARDLDIPVLPLEMRGQVNPGVLREIILFKKENRIDIIHSHGYKADVLAFISSRFSPVRLVSTLHGWTERSARLKLYKRIDLKVVRKFNHLIAVSELIREELMGVGIPPDRITLVPNSIDLDRLQGGAGDRVALKEELGLAGGGPVIGMIGRLDREKNPELLLEAIPPLLDEFTDLRCVFVGDGALKEVLKNRALELGIEKAALFTGYREDVPEIIPLLEVVVFPSWTEGIPISLLESMALKRAVVATRVGGMPDVIEDGENGCLIDAGDRERLIREVKRLLRDGELRRRLGENAALLVRKEYSARRMVNQVKKIYEEVGRE